jgi:N-methylhydantoinase B
VELDPITYEVIKHRLWQINDEQGVTIRTIATSPIVVEGNDMNVGLFSRNGDLVIAGPYVLTHVTTMDTVIKNLIKRAGDIEDGDMFLVNDPYMGALHQNDVAVVSPLFLDGEIILWIGNVLHHVDLAGIDEGSFCINARNVFQEAPRYMLKVVQRGKVSREVEVTFTMNSRLPEMVALDLRAQIGAINVAKQRLQELLEQRGVDTVLAVMDRSVDLAEQQLRERLTELPDGTWSTEVFMDSDRVGSDRIYKVCLRLEKRGDELFFDYTGSDPQAEGAVNATYPACYAGTTTPIYIFLCGGEIDWNASIKRCVHVHAPEGTVMNAQYPAAVSICSIGFTWLAAVAAIKVVAQMFSASAKYRDRVCPSWSASANCNNLFGVNHLGKQVGAMLSDHRGGGAGARCFADGFDHSGQFGSHLSFMSNVESQEWKLPVLYVFRRQLTDSGGPGKYRGGLSVLSALVPYRAKRLIWKSQNTAGSDESNASGIHGGYPGAGSQVSVIRATHLWEMLARGEVPLTYAVFGGEIEHLPSKSEGVLGNDDVLIYYPSGGGGYGDPLERDPQLVQQDILSGAVSPEWARKRYGVMVTQMLAVDEAATELERKRQIRDRLASSSRPSIPVPDRHPGFASNSAVIGEYLERVLVDGSSMIRCRRCGGALACDGSDPREESALRRSSLAEAGPWLALRWRGHTPHFELVQSLCPSCGVLFDVEERLKTS